jgi:hypothetical protein
MKMPIASFKKIAHQIYKKMNEKSGTWKAFQFATDSD